MVCFFLVVVEFCEDEIACEEKQSGQSHSFSGMTTTATQAVWYHV